MIQKKMSWLEKKKVQVCLFWAWVAGLGAVAALKMEEGKALFPSHLELTEAQVDRRQV